MKIMVVMGEYPPEETERRRSAVLKCASPGTEIGFAVIKATFFKHSNSQVNSLSAGPLVAEIAVKAEADGFNAVVPFGTLDAGVELARNLINIPIVGAGQSVLHLGAQLSSRLGVIAYEDKSIPFMRKQMHAWRVADCVVGIRGIGIPLPESTKNREAMRSRFIDSARELIDKYDAEVIVPMGDYGPRAVFAGGDGPRAGCSRYGRSDDQHSNRRDNGAHGISAQRENLSSA